MPKQGTSTPVLRAARTSRWGTLMVYQDVQRDTSGVSRVSTTITYMGLIGIGRCSVTRLLITHPKYRVCSICPAISLLPPSIVSLPIAVDESGRDTDHTRFEKKMTGKGRGGKTEAGIGLAEELLEAAVVCLRCGGRWVRVV